MAKLIFYGGALSVTGANYLIETEKSKVLVDCGMFQGSRHSEKENYESFPYDPKSINAVLITHSHIDHIGRLPKLLKYGFVGDIFATEPTRDLSKIILKDSQEIIEEEAGNKEPLYGIGDVDAVYNYFKTQNYGEFFQVTEDIKVRFRDAGHILGSAIIEVWIKEASKETKVVFSGDLGNPPTAFLKETEYIEEANYVLVETTYGDRIHEDKEERKNFLENAIEDTATNGGTLMIPSFALERTQEVLFELNNLVENSRIPKIPIFLDSPLAIDATEIYKKHQNYFNKKAWDLLKAGDELFNFSNLKLTYTTNESKEINEVPQPKIIIAGSGMSTGGRILHHEMRYLPDEKSTLLIIGYQAEGTLGRQVIDGLKQVKIFGEIIPVRCQIRAIGGYSAHADQEGLYDWVKNIHEGGKLKKVFCVQGEEGPANAFAVKLRDNLAVDAHIPKQKEIFEF